MSSLNTPYHNSTYTSFIVVFCCPKSEGFFCFFLSFLWWVFFKYSAFDFISSVSRILHSTCPTLRKKKGFLLYYITAEPRNSKNPINKSDLFGNLSWWSCFKFGIFLICSADHRNSESEAE